MDKELQNKAWAALPNEFKEGVKETYLEYSKLIAISDKNTDRYKGYLGAQTELELLFGENNLTDENHSKVEKIGKDWKDSEGEAQNFSKNAENENYSGDTSQKTPNLRSNLRLQVATAAMQGMWSNLEYIKHLIVELRYSEKKKNMADTNTDIADDMMTIIAYMSVRQADALLAECGMCHKD